MTVDSDSGDRSTASSRPNRTISSCSNSHTGCRSDRIACLTGLPSAASFFARPSFPEGFCVSRRPCFSSADKIRPFHAIFFTDQTVQLSQCGDPLTDELALLERARDGDLDAFKDVVSTYRDIVYGVAYDLMNNPHDTEDVMQDVFLKVYRGLASFRRESRVSTWIYRITVNTCYDHLSKRSVRSMKPSDDLETPGLDAPLFQTQSASDPERQASSRVLQEHISRAIERLSPRERSVFVLRHYQDLPLKEIANVLRISEGTVKSMMARALRRLQRELAMYRQEARLEES